MLQKTIRSRFVHEIGETVEGCVILERRTVIPPDPVERRRGVYDYLVEVPPAPVKSAPPRKAPVSRNAAPERKVPPEHGSFTRSTPEERSGVVRRLPSR